MNDWDNDNLADEGPLESDLEELACDDESPTTACSACGAEIYEDSPQCSVCGEYIFAGGSSTHHLTRWYLIVAAIALTAFLCYILL